MNKFVYITVLAIIGLNITACRLAEHRDDLPKQTVDLFVRYLQPEKEYKVEAILLEGDSTPLAKSIRFPEGIRFIDKDMTEVQVTESLLRYTTQFGGEYEQSAKFEFQDKRRTEHSLILTMQPLGDIQIDFPTDLNGQVQLSINNGGVLQQTESLVAVLTDRTGQTSTVTIQGPSTSGEYAFPMVSFGNPVKGNGEVYFVKKQVRNEQTGKLNVHLVEELYSASLAVKIP
jgi:hypothetical protein